MKQWFMKFNMHTKMIALSICIVLLTSILLSALFYNSNMAMFEDKLAVISEETIVQAGTYLDSELYHIIQLVHGGILGYDIYDSVRGYLRNPASATISIQEMLTQLVIQSEFIQSAKLITENAQVGNLTNRVIYDVDPILEKAKESEFGIYWHDTLIVDQALDKELLIVVFNLTNTLSMTFSEDVFLVVNLSYDAFERTLKGLENDMFGTVRLVNQSDVPFDNTDISVEDYDYVLTSQLAVSRWQIQTLQQKDVLFAEYYQTQTYTFLVVIFIVILLIIISSYFAQSITTPLHQLTKMAKKMQQQDYSQTYLPSGMPEIDILGNAFNQLQEDLIEYEQIVAHDKQLIKQEEQEKRRVELNLLQAQMNPHFLYNALDSIYWYAHQKEIEKVCAVIINLSKLLRITLSKGDEYISLQQEVDHLEAYLKIQKQIFGKKFNYNIEFDETLAATRIVKIILQPLAENCILHGFSNMQEGGLIFIKIYSIEDTLVLKVLDNGMGFAQSALQKETKHGSGFALNNLRNRLALYYKDRATLQYQTNADGMTEIEIQIQQERKA